MNGFLAEIGGILALVVVFLIAASALFIAGGMSRFNSTTQRIAAGVVALTVVGGPVALTWHETRPTAPAVDQQTDLQRLQQYRDEVRDKMRQMQPPAPRPVAPTEVAPAPLSV